MSSHYRHIFLLCSLWIASSCGSLTLKMLKNRHVIITGPQDLTVFLRSSDKIIVAWTLPQIYVPHDVSDKPFETLKNGDKVGVLEPMFSFEPHVIEKLKKDNATANTVKTTKKADLSSTAAPTKSSNSNETSSDKGDGAKGGDNTIPSGDDKKSSTVAPAATVKADNVTKQTDTSKPTAASPSSSPSDKSKVVKRAVTSGTSQTPTKKLPVNVNHVICKALTEFADFTVGDKEPGIRDNGWAVSLLDSDLKIPTTNMSMFYSDKEHKLVKFEEGCVDKVVVTYTRLSSRPVDTEIVLNASDHLVTIDNLRSAEEYKIVVTAHFVSGDSISAKAIYVSTLRTGVICRCDWHGTKNRTSDCETPSPTQQHCDCNDAYTGRFCQDCADGYYHDAPQHGCKKCPCGEHGGISSSCSMVEGFVKCEECAKGYTGSVCHRCDNGYFRYKDECRKCLCNNNTRPGSPRVCDPMNGNCIDCHYNTSGFYCERCLHGYIRSPIHTGQCYAINEVHSSSDGISSGVVGAIIFVVVLFICIVIGLYVIHRVRANRQRRALWTVEMRPDNDDLDFNSVHNEDARMDDIDDMEFYDRQAGRNKTSGKYSKLNEEC